jgi:hypothetical protein
LLFTNHFTKPTGEPFRTIFINMAATPADVIFDTELMKNQKHASPMDPTKQFDVLRNPDGTAVFFSIGTDNVLNVSQETTASPTGWRKWDISAGIARKFFRFSSITVKRFAVSQNPHNPTNVDIAVVVMDLDYADDKLFLAYDVPNEPNSWEQSLDRYWVAAYFDAPGYFTPFPLRIRELLLMNLSGKERLCYVEVPYDPADDGSRIVVYTIHHGATPRWRYEFVDPPGPTGRSCLGKHPMDSEGGRYHLPSAPWNSHIVYVRFIGSHYLESRLPADEPMTAMSSMLDENGNTFLFAVSAASIYVWTADRQNDGDWGREIQYQHPPDTGILKGTASLTATRQGGRTVLVGLNGLGELYITSSPSGSEGDPEAWSIPTTVCFDVLQFAHCLNVTGSSANNVLFAQTSDQQLTALTQDLNTSLWTERSVLLPPEDVNTVTEYYSYTSHIQVVDENGQGVPNYYPVSLTGFSSVSTYVNDVYHVLSPDRPLLATTNAFGVITVVQEIQSLSGILMGVTVQPPGSELPIAKTIDPHENAAQRLSTLNSAESLRAARITDSNGYKKPLVSQSLSGADLEVAVKKFQTLLSIRQQLLSQGGAKQLKPFPGGTSRPSGATSDSGRTRSSWITLLWGDLTRWLKKAINKVERISAELYEGFWHFVVDIGDLTYSAVMDTVSAVAGTVEYVFKEIGVAYDDIVQYLGFVFNWTDIKRTHFVIKNILKVSTAHAVNSIADMEDGLKREFSTMQERLKDWDKIPDVGGTFGQRQKLQTYVHGYNSPQANWAVHHATSNIQNAQTNHDGQGAISKDITPAFRDICSLVKKEETAVVAMVTQLKDLLVNFSSLSAAQICQQALGIISEFILETAEDCLLTFLDLAKLLADTVLAVLDAPLNIPILSPIYKDITGDQLSFLDLACFIGAIPATVLYKAVTNAAPFPIGDQLWDSLINAPDYGAVSNILNSTQLDEDQQQAYRKYFAKAKISNPRAIEPAKAYDICDAVSNIVAAVATEPYMFMTLKKLRLPEGTPAPRALRWASASIYVAYVMPDIIGSLSEASEWYTILNWIFTAFSIVKTAVDNSDAMGNNSIYSGVIGPILETALNVCWFVPAVGDYLNNRGTDSNLAALYANIAFDGSGALSALASPTMLGPGGAYIFQLLQLELSQGYLASVTATAYYVATGQ